MPGTIFGGHRHLRSHIVTSRCLVQVTLLSDTESTSRSYRPFATSHRSSTKTGSPH